MSTAAPPCPSCSVGTLYFHCKATPNNWQKFCKLYKCDRCESFGQLSKRWWDAVNKVSIDLRKKA